ncbi:MAG: hypothetical protein Q9174_004922 [Haloplaca sp. 1 TL-2023]
MSSYSPYGFIQAKPPDWRPQEDRAASAFIGITLFVCFETLLEIYRVFKKRQGLYFWALLAGVISSAVNIIAMTLKYLAELQGIWPLYTLMALVSWTVFTLAHFLVLYSRLHLVVESPKIQRWVLYLTLFCAIFFLLPCWIVVWGGWNPEMSITEKWSPSEGIVERFSQLGVTLAECFVSGVYINALVRLLRFKPTVRQRRVFVDLVYVSVITITLDIVAVLMVYLNQTGMSHPIQAFSYAIKFRLEFVVLNQLMAVAARGVRRETFGEKRYHLNNSVDSSQWDQHFHSTEPSDFQPGNLKQTSDQSNTQQSKGSTDITVPAEALEAVKSRSRSEQGQTDRSFLPRHGQRRRQPGDEDGGGPGSKARTVARKLRHRSPSTKDHGWTSFKARRKGSSARPEDDDEEDEIPLHMWERNGELMMRIPWFETRDADQPC